MSDSCYPTDCSMPRSSVHGILQARILECVAISFTRGSSRPRNQTPVSCIVGRFFTDWATSEAHGKVLHVFFSMKAQPVATSLISSSTTKMYDSYFQFLVENFVLNWVIWTLRFYSSSVGKILSNWAYTNIYKVAQIFEVSFCYN